MRHPGRVHARPRGALISPSDPFVQHVASLSNNITAFSPRGPVQSSGGGGVSSFQWLIFVDKEQRRDAIKEGFNEQKR